MNIKKEELPSERSYMCTTCSAAALDVIEGDFTEHIREIDNILGDVEDAYFEEAYFDLLRGYLNFRAGVFNGGIPKGDIQRRFKKWQGKFALLKEQAQHAEKVNEESMIIEGDIEDNSVQPEAFSASFNDFVSELTEVAISFPEEVSNPEEENDYEHGE